MSPSSLIFVAVVVMWAAYLVVDTSRRREYLATAQSVERFSASMRVLQRRAVRRETAEAFEASTAPMRSTSSVLLHRPPTRAAVEARAARAAAPVLPGSTGGTKGLAERQERRARVRRARRMAVAALACVALAVVGAVLAGFGIVSWFLPAAGMLGATGLVVLMRRQAVAGRAASRPAVRRTGRTSVAAAPVASTEDAVGHRADVRPAAAAMPVAQEYVPFDVHREVAPLVRLEEVVVAPERDLLLTDDAWAPVFVPPPTYTLKARAEHPVPEPIVVEDPVYDAWIDDEDDDYGVYGRAVNQ